MTAKEAMIVGERVAAQHKRNVLELIEMGSTPERALHGCLVSLSAQIMIELQWASPEQESSPQPLTQ